jgi:hypothetical protein
VKRALTAIGTLALAVFMCAGVAGPLHAQTTARTGNLSSQDTIFTQIQLTREGVTAVDTLGRRWVYDFDNNTFVPNRETPTTGSRTDRHGRTEAVPDPVERRCTQLKVVKPLQKNVLVGYEEYVSGSIVAYGRVVVKGWVKGDVQSFNGRVLVTESGQVDGDIKAPEIVINEGGIVLGAQEQVDPLEFTGDVLRRPFSVDGVIIVCCFLVFLLVAAFLILSLFPRQQEAFEQAMFAYKFKSFMLGLLSLFLVWLPVGLLAITIVGIILIPFVPFVYVAAMTVGVVSLGRRLGRIAMKRITGDSHSGIFEAFVGISALMVVWMVVAVLLGGGDDGSVAYGFGIFALVLAIIISLFPICTGLGAALLTRMGTRQYRPKERPDWMRGSDAPAPAPPPIPQMPDMVMPPPRVSPQDIPRPARPGEDDQDSPGPDGRSPLPSGG